MSQMIMQNDTERRVGDARVEAIFKLVDEQSNRLTSIERSVSALHESQLETNRSVQQMAKAVSSLAVFEKQLVNEHEHRENMTADINRLREELHKFKEKVSDRNAQTASDAASTRTRSKWLEGAFLIVFSAAVMTSLGFLAQRMGAI